jgi:SAM-dependent methyltransferase
MTWDVTLLKHSGLCAYPNCIALLEAYVKCASAGERLCLAAYVAIGSTMARCFGVNITALWKNAETIVSDIAAASCSPPDRVIGFLRSYVKLKREEKDHLPFEQALADIYDQSFYPLATHFAFAFQPSAMARLKFIREVVARMNDSPVVVADLGCGSGVILAEILSMKPSWIGHGLDISTACTDYARRLAAHRGVSDRAWFVAEDIARLPYDNDYLDLAIVSEVMEHVPEPELILMEIARVMRPGGQLILTIPLESVTPAHLQTYHSPDEFFSRCETTNFTIKRLEPQWHFSFGDDRKHLFALMEKPVHARAESAASIVIQEALAG